MKNHQERDSVYNNGIKQNIVSYIVGLVITSVAIVLVAYHTIWRPEALNFGMNHYSDWLINYSGGFVRRGLVGEIIHNIVGNEPAIVVTNWIVFSIFSSFAMGLYLLLVSTSKRLSVIGLVLLVPGSILSMGVGNEFYFHKEILFHLCLVLSAGIVIAISRVSPIQSKKVLFYFLICFDLLVFCTVPFVQEGFIFLSAPAQLFLLYFAGRYVGVNSNKYIILLIIISLSIFILEALFKGTAQISKMIWNSINFVDQRLINPTNPDIPVGGINAIGFGLTKALQDVFAILLTGYAWFWLVPMVFIWYCTYLVIQILLKENKVDSKNIYWYFDLYIYLIFCSLPIYLIAIDWGRWISSNFLSFMILLLVCLRLEKVQGYGFSSAVLPSLSGRFIKNAPSFWVSYGLITMFVVALTMKMPECCILGYDQTLAMFIIRGLKSWFY